MTTTSQARGYISLYLPISRYISLPRRRRRGAISPYISLYLPISPCISLCLRLRPRAQVRVKVLTLSLSLTLTLTQTLTLTLALPLTLPLPLAAAWSSRTRASTWRPSRRMPCPSSTSDRAPAWITAWTTKRCDYGRSCFLLARAHDRSQMQGVV